NKYHHEYKSHGNKIKALSRMVQRVGNATLLTNLTTAVGFAAFIATGNRIWWSLALWPPSTSWRCLCSPFS
ncbi:MAG TPA: hypothetical protein VJ939_00420, partial [Bacteroidales bacterium]|nr:hypothetical protein [Bacteroidales bacterium]